MSKPDARSKDTEEPHYLGHRERLRDRFRSSDPDALPDYELLELILFRAMPRRDTKPIAKALIARFGSFAALFGCAETAAMIRSALAGKFLNPAAE